MQRLGRPAAHVLGSVQPPRLAFTTLENLFCRQMRVEEDSVCAPGIFLPAHQSYRARHSGGWVGGGGRGEITGGIAAGVEKNEEAKSPSAPRSPTAGVAVGRRWLEGFLGELPRFIIDMHDETRHQLTALND